MNLLMKNCLPISCLLMILLSANLWSSVNNDDPQIDPLAVCIPQDNNKEEVICMDLQEKEESSSSNLGDLLSFLKKRIPNLKEVIIDVAYQAPADTFLGDYTNKLGDNPAAKAFIRDIFKIPGSITKANLATQVGGTKYYSDEGHVFGHVGKMVVKVGGIFVLTNLLNIDAKQAGTIVNYPGDYLSRFFIKVGMSKQDNNSTLPYTEYMFNEFNFRWVYESILEASPKIIITNWLGYLVGVKLGVGRYIQQNIFNLANFLPLGGLFLQRTNSAWANVKANKGISFTPYVFAVSFATTMVAHFCDKTITTFILSPFARVTQDVVTLMTDKAREWFEQETVVTEEKTHKEEL